MGKNARDYGTGSIYRQPGCKRWTIQFYVDGHRVKETSGTTVKAEAQAILNQRLAAVSRGEYARPLKPVTVKELYVQMVTRYKGEDRARAVRDLGTPTDLKPDDPKYPPQGRWRHLGPQFGYVRAANVDTEMLDRYIVLRREQKASAATINRELGALRRCLNLAKQSGRVRSLPHFPMLREDNTREGFIGQREFKRLAFLADQEEPWFRLFLELGFTYGWRQGELLGLRTRQVNLHDGTIRLAPGTTKNKEGREVQMKARVRELLTVAVAGKQPDAYVLSRDEPGAERVVDFRWTWYRVCVAAGLGELTCPVCEAKNAVPSNRCAACKRRVRLEYTGLIPHDLRRSAAKRLRAAGIPESVVMKVGGWKTNAMFRRYAIVDSAEQRQVVERLEQLDSVDADRDDPKTALNGTERVAAAKPVTQNVQ